MESLSIKVLIVDDHEVVCRGTKSFLEEDPEIEVVGLASDGYSAVRLVRELQPQVVLVDINMPGLNGIETTKLIKQEKPDIKVIAFSGYDQEQYVLALFKAGAQGFLLKTVSQTKLIEAIKNVSKDLPVVDSSIAGYLVSYVSGIRPNVEHDAKVEVEFTARELEILRFLAEGLSNKEIGTKLSLSSRTVEFHVANVLAKLGVQSRLSAVLEARKRGLLDIDI